MSEPGLEGMAPVGERGGTAHARSVVLRCRAPATRGAAALDRVTRLRGPDQPRRLVAHLARSVELGLGSPHLDQARVEGLDGLWAELLLLAWVHDAEVGLNRAADALLTLDDDRLSRLRDRVGTFDGKLGRRVVRALLRAEGHAGLEDLTLSGLLLRAAPGDGADLDALEAMLDRVEAGGVA